MEWYLVGALIMGILLLLLCTGLPIAASLGLACAGFIVFARGEAGIYIIGDQFVSVFTSYSLVALALFIVMGDLFVVGGTASDLFDVSSKWVGEFPGGLAMVTVMTCALFATLSGSTVAATAAIAAVTIPEMLKRGYDKRLATGVVGVAGGLASLIPPSSGAIVYAVLADVSVGRQLIAGIVPGIILAVVIAIIVLVWTIRTLR